MLNRIEENLRVTLYEYIINEIQYNKNLISLFSNSYNKKYLESAYINTITKPLYSNKILYKRFVKKTGYNNPNCADNIRNWLDILIQEEKTKIKNNKKVRDCLYKIRILCYLIHSGFRLKTNNIIWEWLINREAMTLEEYLYNKYSRVPETYYLFYEQEMDDDFRKEIEMLEFNYYKDICKLEINNSLINLQAHIRSRLLINT